jgi:rare lipoprotein A
MLSTYYGAELAGSPMALGEPFNPYGFMVAHPYLPLGTKLLISYNGRGMIVMINDRGSYGSDYGLDLSSGAAQAIGLANAGGGVVDIEVLDS